MHFIVQSGQHIIQTQDSNWVKNLNKAPLTESISSCPSTAAAMKPEQPETQVGKVKYEMLDDTIVCVQYHAHTVQVHW